MRTNTPDNPLSSNREIHAGFITPDHWVKLGLFQHDNVGEFITFVTLQKGWRAMYHDRWCTLKTMVNRMAS